jgi:hypothetical protein
MSFFLSGSFFFAPTPSRPARYRNISLFINNLYKAFTVSSQYFNPALSSAPL